MRPIIRAFYILLVFLGGMKAFSHAETASLAGLALLGDVDSLSCGGAGRRKRLNLGEARNAEAFGDESRSRKSRMRMR